MLKSLRFIHFLNLKNFKTLNFSSSAGKFKLGCKDPTQSLNPIVKNITKQASAHGMKHVTVSSSMFSCIDHRNTNPSLCTPGGDVVEFINGLSVLLSNNPTTLTSERVEEWLEVFVSRVATEKRPFYLHGDENSVENIFKRVGFNGTVFPTSAPPNLEAWLTSLSSPEGIGCLHLRQIRTLPKEYGITSEFTEFAIRAFFQLLWNENWKNRMKFDILSGDKDPNGILIVENEYQEKDEKRYPLIAPNCGLEKNMFVHHPKAVVEFRTKHVIPTLGEILQVRDLNVEETVAKMNHLSQEQMRLTVEAFASDLPVFYMDIDDQ